MHGAVGRRRPAFGVGDLDRPAMDGGSREARLLQAHALDPRDEVCGCPVPAGITADEACQARQAMPAIARQPALGGPKRDARVGRGAREGNVSFKVRLEHGEAGHGLLAPVFTQSCQGRLCPVRRHGSLPCCHAAQRCCGPVRNRSFSDRFWRSVRKLPFKPFGHRIGSGHPFRTDLAHAAHLRLCPRCLIASSVSSHAFLLFLNLGCTLPGSGLFSRSDARPAARWSPGRDPTLSLHRGPRRPRRA
jgi:hypothetical protein